MPTVRMPPPVAPMSWACSTGWPSSDSFTCPANAISVARQHQGRCDCLNGFMGNPNNRNGSQQQQKHQCRTHAEAQESEAGIKDETTQPVSCRPARESVK
ncbi:GL15434 [Drosophila persimilis]|uniref:GL15434 n=1 Tax=Drosophila persimilis TaxID=7234 RepID=B4ISK0_DROPE|nr:GL15434 [Drosophila persimilis]